MTRTGLSASAGEIWKNLINRAAQLYYSLPDQPAKRFTEQVAREVAALDPVGMKTEVERLNVFNGFLLVANLDTLFDCGLTASPCLRWLTSDHLLFLHWHQTRVFHK